MANPSIPFANFYQKHRGETMLVCGCGYSLRQLRHRPAYPSIGVNDVGRWFTPRYLLVANPEQDFEPERYIAIRTSQAQAVFSPFPLTLELAPRVPFELLHFGGTSIHNPRGLPFTRNSPYMALCLAAFMGATRIGLLGVDFTQHHFFAATGTHPLAYQLKQMNEEYAHLASALEHQGIEVVNLSSQSRITAFPKTSLSQWEAATSFQPSFPPTPIMRPRRSQTMMHVDLDRTGSGILGTFFATLAQSLQSMGARIAFVPRHERGNAPVRFVWNGRGTPRQDALIYCEHGWWPRWYFQMSPLGINADSHCAPFIYRSPLSRQHQVLVVNFQQHLQRLGPKGYMNTRAPALADLPKAFLLVPLQIETDTNICRHVPPSLRSMQHLLDYVSFHDPDLPVLFKQHPADARTRNQHLSLVIRRKGDRLIPHHQGNIHQFLKSGRCKGVIALNSNVVHDSLIWDVPAVVLGKNIWPRSGPGPFLRRIPAETREFADFFDATRDQRLAYCLHLIRNQWSLEDVANPQKLLKFLQQCVHWLENQSA